jgi:hypothetical protein
VKYSSLPQYCLDFSGYIVFCESSVSSFSSNSSICPSSLANLPVIDIEIKTMNPTANARMIAHLANFLTFPLVVVFSPSSDETYASSYLRGSGEET